MVTTGSQTPRVYELRHGTANEKDASCSGDSAARRLLIIPNHYRGAQELVFRLTILCSTEPIRWSGTEHLLDLAHRPYCIAISLGANYECAPYFLRKLDLDHAFLMPPQIVSLEASLHGNDCEIVT